MELTKRSQAALEVLKAGGYIRHGLVTNRYTRREQFEYELFAADGQRVSGHGHAALEPLTHIVPRDQGAIYGSTAQRIYRLTAQLDAA